MKRTNIPEFTAEKSISKSTEHYNTRDLLTSEMGIIPQLKRRFPSAGCNHFCICVVDTFNDPDNCPCCDSININDLKSFFRY
jgi:hypothetical protein